jgi:DMSO reductase anchor subunit
VKPATRSKNLAALIFALAAGLAALLASFMQEGDQIIFVVTRAGLLVFAGLMGALYRIVGEITRWSSRKREDADADK